MVRIISGKFRGRKLKFSERPELRPSSDRLRSGIFSALDARGLIEDSQVLDLFCGTGALGLEALSRGAKHVTFVEQDRGIVKELKAALEVLGAGGSSRVITESVERVLTGDAIKTNAPYQLIFADPPYKDVYPQLPKMLAEKKLVTTGSTFIYESERGKAIEWLPVESGFAELKEFSYGDSMVRLCEFK